MSQPFLGKDGSQNRILLSRDPVKNVGSLEDMSDREDACGDSPWPYRKKRPTDQEDEP